MRAAWFSFNLGSCRSSYVGTGSGSQRARVGEGGADDKGDGRGGGDVSDLVEEIMAEIARARWRGDGSVLEGERRFSLGAGEGDRAGDGVFDLDGGTGGSAILPVVGDGGEWSDVGHSFLAGLEGIESIGRDEDEGDHQEQENVSDRGKCGGDDAVNMCRQDIPFKWPTNPVFMELKGVEGVVERGLPSVRGRCMKLGRTGTRRARRREDSAPICVYCKGDIHPKVPNFMSMVAMTPIAVTSVTPVAADIPAGVRSAAKHQEQLEENITLQTTITDLEVESVISTDGSFVDLKYDEGGQKKGQNSFGLTAIEKGHQQDLEVLNKQIVIMDNIMGNSGVGVENSREKTDAAYTIPSPPVTHTPPLPRHRINRHVDIGPPPSAPLPPLPVTSSAPLRKRALVPRPEAPVPRRVSHSRLPAPSTGPASSSRLPRQTVATPSGPPTRPHKKLRTPATSRLPRPTPPRTVPLTTPIKVVRPCPPVNQRSTFGPPPGSQASPLAARRIPVSEPESRNLTKLPTRTGPRTVRPAPSKSKTRHPLSELPASNNPLPPLTSPFPHKGTPIEPPSTPRFTLPTSISILSCEDPVKKAMIDGLRVQFEMEHPNGTGEEWKACVENHPCMRLAFKSVSAVATPSRHKVDTTPSLPTVHKVTSREDRGKSPCPIPKATPWKREKLPLGSKGNIIGDTRRERGRHGQVKSRGSGGKEKENAVPGVRGASEVRRARTKSERRRLRVYDGQLYG